MKLYRLTKAKYSKDLSGQGAALFGSRWNLVNQHVLYAAQSESLAVLEVLVHQVPGANAQDFVMIQLEIPDSVVKLSKKQRHAFLNDKLDLNATQTIGNEFISQAKSLALEVPSVIVPNESNFVINVRHEWMAEVKIMSSRPFQFDQRLWKVSS